jgi:hypothetical protein
MRGGAIPVRCVHLVTLYESHDAQLAAAMAVDTGLNLAL